MHCNAKAPIVLRPPAMERKTRSFGLSVYLRNASSILSAAAKLSSSDKRSGINSHLSLENVAKEASPIVIDAAFFTPAFTRSAFNCSQTPEQSTSFSKRSLPTLVVHNSIRSGITGSCFRVANAQTVSVNTAGEVPNNAINTTRLSAKPSIRHHLFDTRL